MTHWRVDVLGAEIAPGVRLKFSDENEQGFSIQPGDTFYLVYSDNRRGEGTVVVFDGAGAEILAGDRKWLLNADDDGAWTVTRAVE